MADEFQTYQTGLTSPAEAGAPITPSDATALPYATRAIYVGGAGNLRLTLVGGDTITLQAVAAGMIYPLRASHVRATGTTATALVGLR